jgi:hypothetical protein
MSSELLALFSASLIEGSSIVKFVDIFSNSKTAGRGGGVSGLVKIRIFGSIDMRIFGFSKYIGLRPAAVTFD